MTVREHIEAIEREIRTEETSPSRLCEMSLELSSLYGNCTREVTKRELAYNKVLADAMQGEEAANRATVRAKASPEYADFLEAKNVERACLQLIRTLNRVMDHQKEEMRLAR
jgi:hypothetical protein